MTSIAICLIAESGVVSKAIYIHFPEATAIDSAPLENTPVVVSIAWIKVGVPNPITASAFFKSPVISVVGSILQLNSILVIWIAASVLTSKIILVSTLL